MFNLDKAKVRLDDLLLDPNNPRFFELPNWTRIEPNLYHLEKTQKLALDRFEKTNIGQIDELVDSIMSNGYIPAEMIVVKPYEADQSKYVIIEGNRRLTAIKRIVQNALGPENDSLIQSLQDLEVLVYNSTGDIEQDQINETILQGIRHISGPKEWGAYQKAHLIVQLYDDAAQSWGDIGRRLGLSARVVIRYYRAYKALQQMKNQEEFSQKAKPDLFSLFDEALKSNSIREWLRWQDNSMSFTDYQRLYMFYCLLAGDQDNGRTASITNPQHMRQFSEIIVSGKSDVLAKLLDGELSIETAARLVKPEPLAITLRYSLQMFIDVLAKLPAEQLTNMSSEDLELFDQIIHKIKNIRVLYSAFLQVREDE